ncbi:MAG TPA: rhodanese-like domain-containing protein [Gammaproteobacteria bacterium]
MPVRQLAPKAVREHLADAGGQLLDVREAWEYQLARLPGAIHIPIAELPSRLGELNIREPVIVYCHHGIRSWHAACFLEQNGFTNVGNLAGGIEAWSREIDPQMPRY